VSASRGNLPTIGRDGLKPLEKTENIGRKQGPCLRGIQLDQAQAERHRLCIQFLLHGRQTHIGEAFALHVQEVMSHGRQVVTGCVIEPVVCFLLDYAADSLASVAHVLVHPRSQCKGVVASVITSLEVIARSTVV
jgi:hypothetical protein